MRVLGVTGGIGSGKSTVSAMLAELGMHVVDADQLAREAVAPDSEGLKAVVERFGERVLTPDRALNRRLLGEMVFAHPKARQDLEKIVHPIVAEGYYQAIQHARRRGVPWVVYDVPLLFENKLEDRVDMIAVVWASLSQRKHRLRHRHPPLSEHSIQARLNAQLPLENKLLHADYKIDNDGAMEDTRRRVETLYLMLHHVERANTP